MDPRQGRQSGGAHEAPHEPPDGRRRVPAAVGAIALLGTTVFVGLATAGVGNAAGLSGTMAVQGLTKPGGGVWLPGAASSPGHYWVPDAVLGICQVVSQAGSPPFTTTKCNGTARAATQAVFDPATKKLYVADGSAKSTSVVRFDYSVASEALSNAVVLAVPNATSVGGGAGGGRPSSLALTPDGKKLYVGYIKSGDVMVVNNPAGASAKPVVQRAGTTSDGKGTQGFALVTHTDGGVVHDDLYVAEIGGSGLTAITDVDGTAGRPVCGVSSACGATPVTNSAGLAVSFAPGGLAYNGTVLYVGDAPRNGPASVQQFNPVTKSQSTYSTDVTPAYTSSFDGVRRTQYANITGIGLGLTGDVFVGDDPSAFATTPFNAQGHLWAVRGTALQPTVTGISPASGPTAGGVTVTVTGANLANAAAGATTVAFGAQQASNVSCAADGTSCTATSPAAAGAGSVDVRVTSGDGQTSPATTADLFTYQSAAQPGQPVVTSITPDNGLSDGGTSVTIAGTALMTGANQPTVAFGATPATSVRCSSTTSCTAVSPGGTPGSSVDVQVTTADGTSGVVAADKFTYRSPVGALYAFGITAPKGGLTWAPDALGGHYWVSDHANGLCRLDVAPNVPATSRLHAINWDACDPGFTIGSPGQAVYDPRANADGTHWMYVPDNAVRSPGVWRLTFDPTTATISNPVGMAPGQMDNLKANSLVLDPAKDALYVGDLVDGNIRRINGIGGDPRVQTVDIVATTQPQKPGAPGRGINGTMALLGSKVFLPENNAATYFDTASPCAAVGTTAPCATTALSFLPTPAAVFVSGIATDAKHGLVYISSSPGGARATVFRFDASTITADAPGGTPGSTYVTTAAVPAAGSPEAVVRCSLTCSRTSDPTFTGATTGFFFASGLYVDPSSSALYITEDQTAGARSGRGHAWEVPYIP